MFKNIELIDHQVSRMYADMWMKNSYESNQIRQLHSITSLFVSKKDTYDILNKYVKSYNNFTPELIKRFPDDSLIKIAREGSVCLYCKSVRLTHQYNNFVMLDGIDYFKSHFECDEINFFEFNEDLSEENIFRIWWD